MHLYKIMEIYLYMLQNIFFILHFCDSLIFMLVCLCVHVNHSNNAKFISDSFF
jgi:hypothetical protein